ncbi:MAG: TatD family hydrolase [Oscillospiraceae bacterium]|jgi:TatD DNase family protein|nr:TatD family hydrolase [Oscillospiraceae bacterium]
MIFDTHAHYDDARFDADRHKILASLPSRGVGLVVNPGCCLRSSAAAIELSERHAHVYAAAGVHPHEAAKVGEGYIAALAELAAHKKCVAIGEIGLDYYREYSPRDIQQRVFREQLELAAGLNLPVIIHSRRAHADVCAILAAFPRARGVWHCFSGSGPSARELCEKGWYLGFAGFVTYEGSKKWRSAVALAPPERLLAETDAPYMPPEPHRGGRCDSSMLPRTIACMAEAAGLTAEAMEELTYGNGVALFGV